ncbi:hypothetical protein BS78_08G080400 [Paspalum vaginatum]|nr:hypothetical protein BS78_08G080400 [Paspalum vaginatum]
MLCCPDHGGVIATLCLQGYKPMYINTWAEEERSTKQGHPSAGRTKDYHQHILELHQPASMDRHALTKSTALFREVKNKQSTNLMRRLEPTEARSAETSLWVPHPRTGIYYPKGFEWVMDDVPSGAASFQPSYWFRTGEAESASSMKIEAASLDHPFV